MAFKMTITNTRHDEFGKQEERILIENGQPITSGSELLQLLQAAAKKEFNTTPALPAATKEVPAKAKEIVQHVDVNVKGNSADAIESLKHSLFNMEPKQKPAKEPEVKKAPKTLNLIGAKTEGFTIAEKIGLAQEPEWQEEKVEALNEFIVPQKDDQVQVLIRCFECGYNGTHQTRFGNSYVKCRSCLENLRLERAAEQWGEPDFDGNIYQAQERYKTAKERWEEKNGVQS